MSPGHQVGEITRNPVDGAEMVWVPAGEFPMGSEDGTPDEKPVHRVRLTSGFWLYQTPVTNAQYGKFLAAQPQHEKPANWTDERFDSKQQPVVGVSWPDAVDYATWATAGLPTEAQWEYVARGPKGSMYPWGKDAPDASRAVFGQNGMTGKPAPVGSVARNRSWCGALDLAGNVFQWCADWYGEGYYRTSPPVVPTGSASGQFRVLRGGSWTYTAFYLRASSRYWNVPVDRNTYTGFRCARTP